MHFEEIFGYAWLAMFFLGMSVMVFRLRNRSAYLFVLFFSLAFAYRFFDGRHLASEIADFFVQPLSASDFVGESNNTARAFEVIGLSQTIDTYIFFSLLAATIIAFVFMALSIPKHSGNKK